MSSLKSLAMKIPAFRTASGPDDAHDTSSHLFSLKRDAMHALRIMSNLNEQRKDASHYCDVQIITSDQRDLWAHKVILDVFTKYFDEPGRFIVDNVDAKSMEAFLNFIYTGEEPKLDAENTLKIMTSALELGLNQVFRRALTYCVDNAFEVLSSDYFCSLSFEELSVLPIFEEGLLLDKLQESKYRRIIHKWLSVNPEWRMDNRSEMENLFSKLWTLEDFERALAISVDQQGLANFVQFNYQDLRWYPCEFSCKPANLVETSLNKVVQMGLYKTDHFVFRDTSNNVYYSSTQLKRIWNKSSAPGTLVGSHCLSLKQIDGQIYGLFDCFKKWNGESKKFESVISKDVFHRLELSVRDFALDDRTSNIYFLSAPQAESTCAGILTYVNSTDNPTMVSYAGLSKATNVLAASDDHLLVYGSSETESPEAAVYTYHIGRKLFSQDLYLHKTFDTKGVLFRLNNKIYSMTTTIDDAEKEQYEVKTFPMKFDEEKLNSIDRSDVGISHIKAVCVCPRKAYYDTVYGSQS